MNSNLKQYTFEEVLDKHIGKVGTPERDKFDKEVEEAVSAYRIGEAIKAERLRNNLTQEQLGIQTATLDLGRAGWLALLGQ